MKDWDISDVQDWGPERHELGATIPAAGTGDDYDTGGWRVIRPILDSDKCNDCMICFWSCPDSAIAVKDTHMLGIILKHCKGCGICAEVCPRDALDMQNELELLKEEE